MVFKARLSIKFYIVFILLLGMTVFAWYGIHFLNANEIMMEDEPMDAQTKFIFTLALSAAALSWTFSVFTLIRQIVMKQAFSMDDTGIHGTATAIMVFAFIFVIPIKTIPYSAIIKTSEKDGVFAVQIDKAKIDVIPFLRLFVNKEYHFFFGYSKESKESIKAELNKRICDK